ncbi:MAG: hypothetical protein WCQ78_01895 [Actinomycetes bacterium]|jgi:hypothetical protein|nr:hypothetical protein [Actinomycetota bacterium]
MAKALSKKFTITSGTPSPAELAALEKAIPAPVEQKIESSSLWRKSQVRQPLPRKWGQSF